MTDSSTDFVADETDSSAIPKVLTRTVIPSLTMGLDASDVLECYALVRSAPLHGIANSTIHVQKMAIGMRYRPPGAMAAVAQQQHMEKEKIEITLEYGPQRIGNYEAMPYVQGSEEASSYVGWDNEGKVYYTTKIVTEMYLSSYYMASMTGAVLDKILAQALEYSQRRRRYQPLAVYSVATGDKGLSSSSSHDFARYIWNQLAHLGVEVEPILPPPMYEARVWVDSWEKATPDPTTANQAAEFYQKLYQCLSAIATSDYTPYAPTAQPTASFAPTVVPTISSMSSASTTLLPSGGQPTDALTSSTPTSNPSTDGDVGANFDSSEIPQNETIQTQNPRETAREEDSSRRYLRSIYGISDGSDYRSIQQSGGNDETFDTDDRFSFDDDTTSDLPLEDIPLGDAATGEPSLLTSVPTSIATMPPSKMSPDPTINTPSAGQDVEKANQAAHHAQQAADTAKNVAITEGDSEAADAALEAADAAQAAADATSNAANQAAMEGLLSGDGNVMASIVSTCFTNPQYGISSVDANGTVTVPAFLYKDGAHYFKLNLASPYLDVVKLNTALPPPYNPREFGSGGDLVDWVLALLVLSSVFFLVIVIVQQMGHECFGSLFRCQRWFFNPRKYDYEGNNMDYGNESFHDDEVGIPFSMGGKPTARNSPLSIRVVRHPTPSTASPSLTMPKLDQNRPNSTMPSPQPPASNTNGVELEMRTMSSPAYRTNRLSSISDSDESQPNTSDEEMEVDPAVPQRLMRDPELVDMPYLKSTSKVAVPVGTNGNGTRQSSNVSTTESNGDIDHPNL